MHDISSSPPVQKLHNHSPETIVVAAMASAQLGSRPPSPANEAGEDEPSNEVLISPEERIKIDAAQSRRKSSAWKGFNLKRRLSKVNLKLPFGDSATTGTCTKARSTSMFYHAPTDGIRLSPVEISPTSNDESIADTPNTPTCNNDDSDDDEDSGSDNEANAKSEYLSELESNIVQSLSDSDKTLSDDHNADSSSVDNTASNSDQESEPIRSTTSKSTIEYGQSIPRSILHSSAAAASADPNDDLLDYRRRTQRQLSQPQSLLQQAKRVDFSERTMVKTLDSHLGAHVSRPLDLPLFDEFGNPIAPPRSMTKVKRNRMLSVPNIKLSRLDAVKLRDLRAKSQKDQGSSFAGNLIRRFSKY